MKITTRQLIAALAVLAIAGGCRSPRQSSPDVRDPPGQKDDPATGREGGSDEIVLDEGTLAGIRVETVREREMPRLLRVAGKVQFNEDRVARMLCPLAGQLVDLHVSVGDSVRRGEALCSINSREAAAAVAERIESLKDLELSEKTCAMTRDLFDHEAASRIALQQAENDLTKARSRAARTEEALRVLGLPPDAELSGFNGRVPLRSPLSGKVIERRVTEGQFVQPDSTPILTVADLSSVWLVGEVFERDLGSVQLGQRATVSASAYPRARFEGRVNYISDAIDPSTRTAKVRLSAPNRDGRLKPEMLVTVDLELAVPARVVTLPSRAVFTENGLAFVYAEVGQHRFARRAITFDGNDGGESRVTSGVRAGDRVVVEGALLLREAEHRRAG